MCADINLQERLDIWFIYFQTEINKLIVLELIYS